jgi:CheY-like chemotaxis protein
MMNRILIIDDDLGLTNLLSEYLTSAGFTVDAVHTGEEGLSRAVSGVFGLCRACQCLCLRREAKTLTALSAWKLGPTTIFPSHSTRANWSRAYAPFCDAPKQMKVLLRGLA